MPNICLTGDFLMQDPHWTQVLSALLMPTIAVLGVFIAFFQWKLSKQRLKHELFEKRFAVYDAARSLIASVGIGTKVPQEKEIAYLSSIREAKWILNDDIADYLKEDLYHKIIDLGPIQSRKNYEKEGELINVIRDQYDILDEKFATFLKLSK